MKEQKRTTTLNKILGLFVAFALLLNSNSFYVSAYSSIGVILAVLGIVAIVIINKGEISRKSIFIAIVLTCFILFNSIVVAGPNYIGTNIRFIIILIFALFISQSIPVELFIKYYIDVMVLLTVIALIPHIMVNYLGMTSILSAMPQITNANGVTCHSLIFYNVYTYRFDRLMGVFWEPSIYSSFTCIAILFELCFRKKIRLIPVAVLIWGVISSKSTGGYLLLIILCLIWVLLNMEKGALKSIIRVALIGAIIAGVLFSDQIFQSLLQWNPEVFYKLDVSQQSGSLLTRTDSAKINLEIFKSNPLLGVGFGRVEGIYVGMGGKNETSTLTYFLAAFGFIGIVYIASVISAFLRQTNIYITIRVILVAFFAIVLFKEPYWFSAGMYSIIFVFLTQKTRLHVLE